MLSPLLSLVRVVRGISSTTWVLAQPCPRRPSNHLALTPIVRSTCRDVVFNGVRLENDCNAGKYIMVEVLAFFCSSSGVPVGSHSTRTLFTMARDLEEKAGAGAPPPTRDDDNSSGSYNPHITDAHPEKELTEGEIAALKARVINENEEKQEDLKKARGPTVPAASFWMGKTIRCSSRLRRNLPYTTIPIWQNTSNHTQSMKTFIASTQKSDGRGARRWYVEVRAFAWFC
jgi:hypothetical protein